MHLINFYGTIISPYGKKLVLFKNEYQKTVNKDPEKILTEEERKRLLNLPGNTDINTY